METLLANPEREVKCPALETPLLIGVIGPAFKNLNRVHVANYCRLEDHSTKGVFCDGQYLITCKSMKDELEHVTVLLIDAST